MAGQLQPEYFHVFSSLLVLQGCGTLASFLLVDLPQLQWCHHIRLNRLLLCVCAHVYVCAYVITLCGVCIYIYFFNFNKDILDLFLARAVHIFCSSLAAFSLKLFFLPVSITICESFWMPSRAEMNFS